MRIDVWKQRLAVAIALILLVATGSTTGARQDDGTPAPEESGPPPVALVLHPAGQGLQSFFDVEMNPGERQTVSVIAGNDGTLTVPTKLYAADAYTLRNGGFGLNEFDAVKTGPTLWINLDTEDLELETGSRIERPFEISVPEGTPPGEYMTGIAMETTFPSESPEESEGVSFRLENRFRVVRAIRVTVPGPIVPGIDIGSVSVRYLPGSTVIVVNVQNTGNVLIRPVGEVTIRDMDGAEIVSGSVELSVVYASHTAELWLPLGTDFPNGEYLLDLTLADSGQGISDSVTDVPIRIELAGETDAPLAIESASAAAAPSEAEIQVANISASIRNDGEPITNARLTLVAYLDGVEVDRFAISQSLSVPNGMSEVTTRYVPLTGWTSGEWTFELLLETVEPNGTVIVSSRLTIEEVISVP